MRVYYQRGEERTNKPTKNQTDLRLYRSNYRPIIGVHFNTTLGALHHFVL